MLDLNWKYDKDENELISGDHILRFTISESIIEDGVYKVKLFYKSTTIRLLSGNEWVTLKNKKQATKFGSLEEGKKELETVLSNINNVNDIKKVLKIKF